MSRFVNPGQVRSFHTTFVTRPVQNNSNRDDKFKVRYGRVLDVILDNAHPLWQAMGCSQAQYGVFYQNVFEDVDNSSTEYGFAYCYNNNFRRLPLRNEIVSLKPSFSAELSGELSTKQSERIYWVDIIPVWNLPFLNEYPIESSPSFGKFFTDDPKNTNPLQLCPGDVSVEGRHGQSIRFGGTWYNSSPLAVEDTNGSPYITIRNGQGKEESQGDKAIFEDINQDKASIYLTSNHKVDLQQANTKRAAWQEAPVQASDYKGAQILFNANRIFINSKQDDVQVSAKTSVGINAGTAIGLDAKDYIGLDAKKIYLGSRALKEKEPVLLGESTVSWLSNLCDVLDTFLSMTSGVTSPGNASLVGSASSTAKPQLLTLKTKIKSLQSKKTYTE